MLCSILADIEETLKTGDYNIDPFGLLNVYEVSVDNGFLKYINEEIDPEALKIHTLLFDKERWKSLKCNNMYLELYPEVRESVLRLAWWICNEIIYNKPKVNSLFIDSDLCKINGVPEKVRICIYKPTGFNHYQISVIRSLGSFMTIQFKYNKILIS